MQTIDQNITINAPASKVYEFLKDTSKLTSWMVSLGEVSNVKGEGVGQTYDWIYRMAGIPLKGSTTVVEDVPNERVKTKSSGGIDSSFLFTFASDGDTTKLNLRVDYSVPVPVLGALAEKLIVGRNRRESMTGLENLKELLEA
jgi:uncharacterized membrane protein